MQKATHTYIVQLKQTTYKSAMNDALSHTQNIFIHIQIFIMNSIEWTFIRSPSSHVLRCMIFLSFLSKNKKYVTWYCTNIWKIKDLSNVYQGVINCTDFSNLMSILTKNNLHLTNHIGLFATMGSKWIIMVWW